MKKSWLARTFGQEGESASFVLVALLVLASGVVVTRAPAPAWPGSLWRPYDPVPAYVGRRAAELLGALWDLPAGKMRTPSYRTELGERGEWVTYAAQWHGPKMGVTAFVARGA